MQSAHDLVDEAQHALALDRLGDLVADVVDQTARGEADNRGDEHRQHRGAVLRG